MITLTTILWIFASKFDFTETRTLALMFIAAISFEGAEHFLSKRLSKSE